MADWQRDLIARYRWQFPDRGFSFEVGAGWADLMAEMCRRVDVVLDEEWRDGSFRWSQIKEKFGTLRAYSSGPEEVERIVDWAEAASAETCDVCGCRGRMRQEGWLAVRCDVHAPT